MNVLYLFILDERERNQHMMNNIDIFDNKHKKYLKKYMNELPSIRSPSLMQVNINTIEQILDELSIFNTLYYIMFFILPICHMITTTVFQK